MKIRSLLYIMVGVAMAACKPEIDEFSPNQGSADFTKYIALGNTYVAGYADGDVGMTSQNYAFPNILAGQFKLVGGGPFNTPFMVDDLGFGTKKKLSYYQDCLGATNFGPVSAGPVNMANFQSVKDQGPFNNLGVPGTKSFMATLAGLGNLNPYYGRFMASASSSLIGEAVAASPTFFTLWLGTDDVMQYAIKGGDTGGDSITPISIFRQAMSGVVSGLISNGAKGVLANIPDISVMPYFTTIPIKGLPLDAAKAAQLNGMFATYNAGAAAYGVPPMQFQEGANYWIIEDNNFPYDSLGGLRQIRPGEFLTLKLPQDSLKCALWGSPLKPIPANFVVDAGEILKIKAATLQFNEFISGLASEQGLALVDIYSLFNSLSAGLVYDGIKFNSVFVQGGFYSLDGLHPNPRGNAIIANSFIDAINGMYGCKIPSVKVSDFPGTTFP